MTEILVYGVIGDWWDGLEATRLIPLISAGDDDLDIRINSPGGLVMEGIAIFNAITRERAKGRKVTTYVDGLAASMGSIIAMAGGEIVMADNALMMIHNPWDCACGDAIELRSAADRLDQLRDIMVSIYAKQTGIDAATLIPMLDAETWLTASEALDQKFITSISSVEVAAAQVAAFDIKQFGFRKAPDSSRIAAMAMGTTRPAFAGPKPKGNDMPHPQGNDTVPGNQAPDTITTEAAQALASTASAAAVTAERTRISGIRALVEKHKLGTALADTLIAEGKSLEDARGVILDKLAEAGDAVGIGHSGPAVVTQDAREKFKIGAMNSIIHRAGLAGLINAAAKARGDKIDLDPGEFRGIRNVELARMSLDMAGIRCASYDRDVIVKMAIGAQGSSSYQTTSEFPVLLENVMHKVLQAAYAITPDTWSRFCGVGSVSDFRAHNRYLRGTFSSLDDLLENGEFQNKPIPDAAKETITAKTKGNIIALSRQAIVNDDMDAFSGLAVDLGRAAKLSIEKDVYALLAQNGGFGPTMNDGKALFHVDHLNVGTGAPSVVAFDAMAVLMGSQLDLSGNEFLDIRPAVWLGPLSLRGTVDVINRSEYDPDTANKLQKPNMVAGMFQDVVGTPRLTGTPWYSFADPNIAPAIEVAFLDGVQEPFLDSEEGWRVDGTEWKVRFDYGVGGVNSRSAGRSTGVA
ncbi:ClpP-like prohead protease/major capsid protein fusion protein [Sphingomonas sp. SRS2]|uniref:ClpP-like prohead protease/major capsid protein fusion protein n=1 Tax=Sphingomonas sp. SRS2 TaxID=133190 RepID=UPI0006184683|nr:ClpP-like prohead protease/major capsid protein fusion protein [Sphingomonas sp. SRS2]KKC24858.1 peptidase S14 [Sphingomonas sp. SRS2]